MIPQLPTLTQDEKLDRTRTMLPLLSKVCSGSRFSILSMSVLNACEVHITSHIKMEHFS